MATPKKTVTKKTTQSTPAKAVKSSAPSLSGNSMYNLMTQLVQEQKSLWRIQNEYIKDAGKDKELKDFWLDVAEEKQMLIEDLQTIIALEMN